MDLKKELYEHIVKQYLKNKESGFDNDYSLIANGILDSFTLMNFVVHIEKTYAIEVDEITPEHFESINTLADFITKKISAKEKTSFLKPDAKLKQVYGDEAYSKAVAILPRLDTYYIQLGTVIAPYFIRSARPSFRSECVNTDDYGFRFSHDQYGIVDSNTWFTRKRRGLAIGNSYIFSFGVENDKQTLVSYLNEFGKYSFLNLGVMAGNSTQEFITSIPFLKHADYILVCSGSANLFLNLKRLGRYGLYGPFEGEDVLSNLSNIEFRTLRAMLTNPEIKFSLSENIKYQKTPEGLELTDIELESMLEQAVQRHQRDLEMIVRICGSSVPVLFALQPLAMIAKPELSPEEKVLFDIYQRQDQIWTKVFYYGVKVWKQYTQKLKQVCEDLKVSFTDINEIKFEGWSFIDPGHQVDKGYSQVAQHLIKQMEHS